MPAGTIGGSDYQSLQSGYDASVDGDVIQNQSGRFTENLNINHSKAVTLHAAMTATITTNTGEIIIKGNMTINNGRLKMRVET